MSLRTDLALAMGAYDEVIRPTYDDYQSLFRPVSITLFEDTVANLEAAIGRLLMEGWEGLGGIREGTEPATDQPAFVQDMWLYLKNAKEWRSIASQS